MVTRTTMLKVAVAMALSATPASALGGGPDRSPSVEISPSIRPANPPGLAETEIPHFPVEVSRAQFIQALITLPVRCEGESVKRIADSVDSAIGGRSEVARQALVNLVFTENAISREAIHSAIISLGRYQDGSSGLNHVARHASAIATRVYEGQPYAEENKHIAQRAVISSIEYGILVAVLEGAKLGRSAEARELVSSLTASKVFDVGELAAAALSNWR